VLVAVAVVVLVFDLVLLILVAVSAARLREGRPPILATSWSLVDFFFAAQLVAGAVLAFGFAAAFFAETARPSGVTPGMQPEAQLATFIRAHPIALFSVLAFQDLALFAVPLLYFRYKYRIKARDVGLTTRGLGKWVLIGLVIAAFTVIAVDYLQALNEAAVERYKDLPVVRSAEKFSDKNSPDTIVGELIGAWHPAVGILAVAVLAPIAEEVFFRAFTYNVFRARLGVAWGIVISSIIFAGIHFDPARLPTYLIIAVILAYSYERTKNLVVPIIIHFVNNLAAIVVLYWFPAAH
jgi:membrane protease YdiL (CAAX protease family)